MNHVVYFKWNQLKENFNSKIDDAMPITAQPNQKSEISYMSVLKRGFDCR